MEFESLKPTEVGEYGTTTGSNPVSVTNKTALVTNKSNQLLVKGWANIIGLASRYK